MIAKDSEQRCPQRKNLFKILLGDFSKEKRTTFCKHVAVCPECREAFERIRSGFETYFRSKAS